MKGLLYITNLRLPTEKAYGIQIVKMCEAFANQGVALELMMPSRQVVIREDIFSYYNIQKNFRTNKLRTPDFYLPGILDGIAVIIKEFISAVIIVFAVLASKSENIYSRDELPIFLLSFFRKNIIFEAHRYSQRRVWYYRRFRNSGIKVVAISSGVHEKFMQMGFTSSQVLLAPDGVDVGQFQDALSKKECRDYLKLPHDKILVTYAGQLYPWKGVDSLMEAARSLDERFQVVVVGGSKVDVARYSKKYAGCLNVSFIGWRPHRLVPMFLAASDILILPNSSKEDISKIYTSPLKMFEYMVSERPIVASDLPSIREILTDEMAYFVSPDDALSLAAGVVAAATDVEGSLRRASNARSAVTQYSWDERARSILRLF